MISDSVPWRDELGKVARQLRGRENQKRWTERTAYLIERDLMMGMFAIRRLIESGKCSSRLPKRRIPAQLATLTGREPDLIDRWTPWEHYDLDNARSIELNVWSLAQQFIHSFILMLDVAENGVTLTGVFVGSDFTKRSHLYRVDLQTIIDLFEYVAREGVMHSSIYRRDGTNTRFTISQHDLVEVGLAEYDNADQDYVRFLDAIHDDATVRAAFPELGDYEVTRMRTPSWNNKTERLREV